MRSLPIMLVCAGMLCACASVEKSSDSYTLYLVRHAEKMSAEKMSGDNKDPVLSPVGEARASQLAIHLRNKGISDVWSSDYQRTRNTAAPLAGALGLEVKIYDPRDQQTLVQLLEKRRHNALIVGHSNTIPELARLLCQCAVADMDETQYDRLYVISVHNGTAKLETLVQ